MKLGSAYLFDMSVTITGFALRTTLVSRATLKVLGNNIDALDTLERFPPFVGTALCLEGR